MTNKSAVGYVRVSSSKQTEMSINEQKKRIKKYASDNQLDLKQIFEEVRSAKGGIRKQFAKMLVDVEAQAIIDICISNGKVLYYGT